MRTYPLLLLTTIILAQLFFGCARRSDAWTILDNAESIMEAHPDSALSIIESIDTNHLLDREERARYALLKSMAFDKNYIDTTTFNVLQPAIDYYLEHGAPDQRLRTLYYQGRIYQNQGDDDLAMKSYVNALDIVDKCSDSLTIARLHAARGYIFGHLYNFESCVEEYLMAANYFSIPDRLRNRFECHLDALNGFILMRDRVHADSILGICSLEAVDKASKDRLETYKFTYISTFGNKEEIRSFMEEAEKRPIHSMTELLDRSLAYWRIGEWQKVLYLLDFVDDQTISEQPLRYYGLLYLAHESNGNYRDAYQALIKYNALGDSIRDIKFENKLQTSNFRHTQNLQRQKLEAKNSKITIISVCCILILIFCITLLIIINRSVHQKRELAKQQLHAKVLENDKLQAEKQRIAAEIDNERLANENLNLENQRLLLQQSNQALESENLRHRVFQLETECDEFKSILSSKNDLPDDVVTVIKERIEMLNAIIAGTITDDDRFSDVADQRIKDLIEDRKGFMETNRMAFEATHPKFITYLKNHNLTTEEINYVCLYAIGLKGKEVGAYIMRPSHVNISSAIRKKLGLDIHGTNIGIYTRRLLASL